MKVAKFVGARHITVGRFERPRVFNTNLSYMCAAEPRSRFGVGNGHTTNCVFLLDTTRPLPQNPLNFSRGICGKVLGASCSIFPAGLCNASIRSARRAASGCGQTRCSRTFAPIAPLRCTACHRRWGRACGCVHGRWGRTGRRVHGAKRLKSHARLPTAGPKESLAVK